MNGSASFNDSLAVTYLRKHLQKKHWTIQWIRIGEPIQMIRFT